MSENNLPGVNVVKGIFWAAIASTLWGISGTVLQFIAQGQAIPAGWLLSTRTIGAGAILLIFSLFKYGMKSFNVFKSWRTIGWLLAYAVFGLMLNLLTFYYSVQTGNAASATILQYLSPLFIVVGSLVFKGIRPLRSDLIAFVISMLGVFLAITKGDIHQLSIPLDSLLWGIGSGITAAFYVVLPRPVIEEHHSPILVLGWGTFIAGVLFNLNHPFWLDTPPITGTLVASVMTVIVVGTILPFGLLLYSLNFAPSDVVSIVDAVQPVMTFILSVIFLSLDVSIVEIIGSALVIFAIYILQRGRRALDHELIE
ncbi:DMT family transporter [Secundilactobacillus oryzae]|nr:DMT family transporter [Secundilactobacillus oryzae]